MLSSSGCSTQRYYRPANLPTELAATHVPNVRTLDLSQLAGPVQGSELISPGDVLDLSIAGGLAADAVTSFPIRVGDDGTVLVPEVGTVRLAGLELAEAEQAIAGACIQRGLYLQPQVAITIKNRRVNRVTVVGAVEEPGIHELPRGSSYLLDALTAAGGLAEDAGADVDIRLPDPTENLASAAGPAGDRAVRPAGAEMPLDSGPKSIHINLADSVLHGGGGAYLSDGAVVMVQRREPMPIQVIGLVKKPGQYEYPVNQDLDVLGALALAGGVSNTFADRVLVIRKRAEMKNPAVVHVSINRAKRSGQENLRLEPGDTVSVEKTAATIALDAINVVRFTLGSSVPLF